MTIVALADQKMHTKSGKTEQEQTKNNEGDGNEKVTHYATLENACNYFIMPQQLAPPLGNTFSLDGWLI